MRLNKKKIELIKNRDYDTFEKLYYDYYKLVKYIIFQKVNNNEDSDDLVQEVFMKVFHKIDTYDSQYTFECWISEISRNTALDFLKKRGKMQVDLIDDMSVIPDEQTQESEIGDELDEKIRSVIEKEEYQIVCYRIYSNLKFKEIAKLLHSNVSIVSNKYYRAIEKLKREIKKEDFYE